MHKEIFNRTNHKKLQTVYVSKKYLKNEKNVSSLWNHIGILQKLHFWVIGIQKFDFFPFLSVKPAYV